MRIEFLKMQGLGNDFMVLDAAAFADDTILDSAKLRALGDRHTGIGFDQALWLETPRSPQTRVFYRVFNADGSEVEQCGNGARCIAALMFERHPFLGREVIMESAAGIVEARIREDGLVTVDMGIPNFDPGSLPMGMQAEAPAYSIEIDGEDIEYGAVSMGNPHAVICVPDVRSASVEHIGAAIERHPLFPKRTNVGFMQILSRKHISLRVYERGAGETLACGTGACAAAAVGQKRGLLDWEVRVDLPGGTAFVSWPGIGEHIRLTGPARTVFSGSIDI